MPAALTNGLYKIAFETPSGAEYGVAYLQDGKLRGGDSGMAYVGSYELDGTLLSAEISVSQHRYIPGAVSALGINDIQIHLNGLVDDANVVRLTGTSPVSSSARFKARLSLLTDWRLRLRRRVMDLEMRLGIKLFERTTRGAEVTENGGVSFAC